MRFAIEDTTNIDLPEFHHAPTFAAAIRLADELGIGRADAIIDLKTRKIVATIATSWDGYTPIIVIGNTRARLADIAAKWVRDSVGPRYQQIVPDID